MTDSSKNLKPNGEISIRTAFMIIVGILGIIGIAMYSPDNKAKKPAKTGPSTALTQCRNAVRADLKNPRSANFKGVFDSPLNDVTSLGSRRFRITSWVEAQNGFGATIRRTFSCTVNMASRNIENLLII